MIQFKRLDHVQICIPKGSEEEARKFYAGLLGLEEIEKPDSLKPNGGIWFRTAGIELHLGVEENLVKTKAHFAMEIEKLSDVKTFLWKHEVTIKEETSIPGRERFSFFDPFGNRIELFEFTG